MTVFVVEGPQFEDLKHIEPQVLHDVCRCADAFGPCKTVTSGCQVIAKSRRASAPRNGPRNALVYRSHPIDVSIKEGFRIYEQKPATWTTLTASCKSAQDAKISKLSRASALRGSVGHKQDILKPRGDLMAFLGTSFCPAGPVPLANLAATSCSHSLLQDIPNASQRIFLPSMPVLDTQTASSGKPEGSTNAESILKPPTLRSLLSDLPNRHARYRKMLRELQEDAYVAPMPLLYQRTHNPHAPNTMSPLNPLRHLYPKSLWSRQESVPQFRQYFGYDNSKSRRWVPKVRNRNSCDLNADSKRYLKSGSHHCEYCRNDNLWVRLLAHRLYWRRVFSGMEEELSSPYSPPSLLFEFMPSPPSSPPSSLREELFSELPSDSQDEIDVDPPDTPELEYLDDFDDCAARSGWYSHEPEFLDEDLIK